MAFLSSIKTIVKKLIYGYACDSDSYIAFLKKKGAKIGEDVNIFHIRNTHIDEVNPHLLTIGNHVNIVGSCILTHDYSWSVIKTKTGKILGNQQEVKIGNNIFIGYGSIILGGSEIGDNVIIGAHSVVSGKVESDSVYAGVPDRKICSLSDFIVKRDRKQLDEAVNVVKKYNSAFHAIPPIEVLHEYFYLFMDSSDEKLQVFRNKLELCGNYDESISYLKENKPQFNGYDDFIAFCKKEIDSGEK